MISLHNIETERPTIPDFELILEVTHSFFRNRDGYAVIYPNRTPTRSNLPFLMMLHYGEHDIDGDEIFMDTWTTHIRRFNSLPLADFDHSRVRINYAY